MTDIELLQAKEKSLHISLSEALVEGDYTKIVAICEALITITKRQRELYHSADVAIPCLIQQKSARLRHYEALLFSFSRPYHEAPLLRAAN